MRKSDRADSSQSTYSYRCMVNELKELENANDSPTDDILVIETDKAVEIKVVEKVEMV